MVNKEQINVRGQIDEGECKVKLTLTHAHEHMMLTVSNQLISVAVAFSKMRAIQFTLGSIRCLFKINFSSALFADPFLLIIFSADALRGQKGFIGPINAVFITF